VPWSHWMEYIENNFTAPPNSDKIVDILAQSSADFALTYAYNFHATHILGASRGHLSDSVTFLFDYIVHRV